MDIFKQKRYLWFVIVLLLLLNFATLSLLWMGRPGERPLRDRNKNPIESQRHIQHLLKKELGFDQEQTEEYLKKVKRHRNQAQLLESEIRRIKKQMFDEVLQNNPRQELSDSLLILAQQKQAKIEQLTFQHFLDLKKMCKPEQRDKLKLLMHEVLRPAGPPPGMKNEGSYRPPRGAELPPPPPGNKQRPQPPEKR